jgi:hypothetical protein
MDGKRKKTKKIRFELTRKAICGIGVVCFCIFFWMFLLGVWTGQSLLVPTSQERMALKKSMEQLKNTVAGFEERKNINN